MAVYDAGAGAGAVSKVGVRAAALRGLGLSKGSPFSNVRVRNWLCKWEFSQGIFVNSYWASLLPVRLQTRTVVGV